MEGQKKRKTTTSSEVKARYNKKTYVQYTVSFRKDTDEDIIEKVEAEKATGLSTADVFRKLIRKK